MVANEEQPVAEASRTFNYRDGWHALMLGVFKNCCATLTHTILTTDRDFKDAVGEEKAVQDGEAHDLAVVEIWDWNPGHPAREPDF